ncbi:hypothetical protein QFZ63_001503 [Streptomyces sp. B3I7]|uniref:hypothetical protein n=1 Tax=Streptomyces sp. B3I7 TaxID=3042269 RepID=UPI00277F1D05|nr:hypothetical protein [Streptomyces sp. B3I7]MDQ0809789.1 hypothetical protein [Streptomyces sp. B3I7]
MKPTETLPASMARDIVIYPVGLLAEWQRFVHFPDRKYARRSLRSSLRREWGRIRAGQWRDAKNYFNGYLAEHAHLGTRCGTGWTRGRAYRDLARHLNSDPRQLT